MEQYKEYFNLFGMISFYHREDPTHHITLYSDGCKIFVIDFDKNRGITRKKYDIMQDSILLGKLKDGGFIAII